MTSLSIPAHWRRPLLIGVAANLLALYLTRRSLLDPNRAWRLHAPDLRLLARQGFAVQLHLLAAFAALLVALYLLNGAKGTRLHRTLGWGWSIMMMAVALSAFFIRDLNPGRLSLLHVLAGGTAFATPLAVWAARTHRVKLHRGIMTGLAVGGLFIAGALTFAPGRLMWRVFFG